MIAVLKRTLSCNATEKCVFSVQIDIWMDGWTYELITKVISKTLQRKACYTVCNMPRDAGCQKLSKDQGKSH